MQRGLIRHTNNEYYECGFEIHLMGKDRIMGGIRKRGKKISLQAMSTVETVAKETGYQDPEIA